MSLSPVQFESASPLPILEAHDVVFAFGETPALRGANVTVNEGEILAVMGPFGSGKSTLLHSSGRGLGGRLRSGDEATSRIARTRRSANHDQPERLRDFQANSQGRSLRFARDREAAGMKR